MPYPTYFAGAQFIHFLLGPAVVALAWPLWLRREELRRGRLLLAAVAGGAAASGSALLQGWAAGLPVEVTLSLAPKSVTAPVAMGIAEKIGGIPALAAMFAVVTGLVGALSGKYLFDALRIPVDAAGWAAWFCAGHGISRAGRRAGLAGQCRRGRSAGLALGLQVVLASALVPLAFRWQ